LLRAAAEASAPPEARDAFMNHIKRCNECNKYDPPIRSYFSFDFPEKAN
jgi:hypothetical protein